MDGWMDGDGDAIRACGKHALLLNFAKMQCSAAGECFHEAVQRLYGAKRCAVLIAASAIASYSDTTRRTGQ
eukprot:CAMPEP_0198116620 /NCGR_PEP_ID=MMETSP1442-20131203/13596_1 /TAXON_ID= /ORGANISM="Craspedostauros australis, Strain CCMP3328" /LENGTH=70 /DNA_ID=CAMNT_0043774489 /DNA_START=81 /DNA_END=290 /DNA_ORIENTATION=-